MYLLDNFLRLLTCGGRVHAANTAIFQHIRYSAFNISEDGETGICLRREGLKIRVGNTVSERGV